MQIKSAQVEHDRIAEALMIRSRCLRTIDAARIIGSSLQFFVQPIHSFHARRAHVSLTSCHSFDAVSFNAHAHAGRSDEWIDCVNRNLLGRFILLGF